VVFFSCRVPRRWILIHLRVFGVPRPAGGTPQSPPAGHLEKMGVIFTLGVYLGGHFGGGTLGGALWGGRVPRLALLGASGSDAFRIQDPTRIRMRVGAPHAGHRTTAESQLRLVIRLIAVHPELHADWMIVCAIGSGRAVVSTMKHHRVSKL